MKSEYWRVQIRTEIPGKTIVEIRGPNAAIEVDRESWPHIRDRVERCLEWSKTIPPLPRDLVGDIAFPE